MNNKDQEDPIQKAADDLSIAIGEPVSRYTIEKVIKTYEPVRPVQEVADAIRASLVRQQNGKTLESSAGDLPQLWWTHTRR
jgi:hypothetical protein